MNFTTAGPDDEVAREPLLARLLRHNPNHLKQFSALKTDLEQIEFIDKEIRRYHELPRFIRDAKNSYVSVKHKEMAKNFSEAGLFLSALQRYTTCIATAKTDYVLASGYADRAECLLKLQKFRESVTVSKKFVSLVCHDKFAGHRSRNRI